MSATHAKTATVRLYTKRVASCIGCPNGLGKWEGIGTWCNKVPLAEWYWHVPNPDSIPDWCPLPPATDKDSLTAEERK
jgi:hypothetical protein